MFRSNSHEARHRGTRVPTTRASRRANGPVAGHSIPGPSAGHGIPAPSAAYRPGRPVAGIKR